MSALLSYLPVIGSSASIDTRCQHAADREGKKTMTNFVIERVGRHPTYEEVDACLLRARKMRSQAISTGLAQIRDALRRAVNLKGLSLKAKTA
jgi:hypothetical protein